MQVSIDLKDFTSLLSAARLGAKRGEGFVANFVVREWKEIISRLENMPLDDGRSREELDMAFLEDFAADCAKYGCE